MAIEIFQTLDIIEVMENFIERKRPPENMRHQLDLSYKIEDQSVIVFEIRPQFRSPDKKIEVNIGKATFVKSKNIWKIFWMRADMKWHSYDPQPTVKNLKEFLIILEEDRFGCFWG